MRPASAVQAVVPGRPAAVGILPGTVTGMDVDAYQQAALSTALYPDRGRNLAYPALGLAGEAGEVLAAVGDGVAVDDVQAEVGDVLWYCAVLAHEAGLLLSDVVPTWPAATSQPGERQQTCLPGAVLLCRAAARCAELVKKCLRDDSGVLTESRRSALGAALGDVLQAAATVAPAGIEVAAQANADKLASRHARGVVRGDGDHR